MPFTALIRLLPRRAASPRRLTQMAACATSLLLAACGGGGGEDAAGSSSQTLSQSVPSVPTEACYPGMRDDVLAAVNAYRAAGATCADGTQYASAPPLAWHDAMEQAAQVHSQAMIDTDEFAHQVSGEADLGQRLLAAGYGYASARENIAAGYDGVQTVVDAWMQSDKGHCNNIMEPALEHIGVVCLVPGTTRTYHNYWTMDLGRLLR